jgi:hypothetical protein
VSCADLLDGCAMIRVHSWAFMKAPASARQGGRAPPFSWAHGRLRRCPRARRHGLRESDPARDRTHCPMGDRKRTIPCRSCQATRNVKCRTQISSLLSLFSDSVPNGTTTPREAAGGPGARKGPRTPPWAFSHGKRPQSAGKPGRRQTPRDRRKSLQIRPTQKPLHTTENRGVPGSSPGLAIGGSAC